MKHTSEMIRSFLAFEISDVSKDWIEERKREMARGSRGGVRWVKRNALHLTLHFFGKIPIRSVEEIGGVLKTFAKPFSPMALRVRGIGAFPNLRNPRVLWAGVEDVSGERRLQTFHRALQAILQQEGFSVEKRPFTPHVTIGRVKGPFRLNRDLLRDLPECAPFTVGELAFFRSDLTPEGPVYQLLNRFSFEGENT